MACHTRKASLGGSFFKGNFHLNARVQPLRPLRSVYVGQASLNFLVIHYHSVPDYAAATVINYHQRKQVRAHSSVAGVPHGSNLVEHLLIEMNSERFHSLDWMRMRLRRLQ